MFSSHHECSKKAKEANLNVRDGLRKIGAAFLSTREVSAQECVYRCMPELWLRKYSRKLSLLARILLKIALDLRRNNKNLMS
jgi:hypothetical protein